MGIKMRLLQPFNCRQIGDVMEMSLVMAGEMEKHGMAEVTEDDVTPNPGRSPDSEVGMTSGEWAKNARAEAMASGDWKEEGEDKPKRGRPKKVAEEMTADE